LRCACCSACAWACASSFAVCSADGTVQYAVSRMPPAHSSAFQRLAKTVFILGPNGIIAGI
jgi:hypothetical protein